MKKKRPDTGGFKPFCAPEPVKVEDSSAGQVSGLWIKAVIVLGTAIFIGVKMEMNWILDINDPEFNPLNFLVLGLAAYGMVTVGQALWLGAKRKRFGKSVMQLSGDGVARMGGEVKGVVRTAKPLNGTDKAKVTLSCFDTHQFKEMDVGSTREYRAFVVWEETVEVSLTGLDTVEKGIPFSFQMPVKVGEEPKKREPGTAYFKGKFALMIPGLKPRIWTHGEQPVARVWRLEVKAVTAEGAYRVVFDVPVEQR